MRLKLANKEYWKKVHHESNDINHSQYLNYRYARTSIMSDSSKIPMPFFCFQLLDPYLGTSFRVTYSNNGDHLEPFAFARSLINKNPFKYKKYPRTPPLSPTLSPSKELHDNKSQIYKLEEGLETTSSPSSEVTTGKTNIYSL